MKKHQRLSIATILLFSFCKGFTQENFRFKTTTDSIAADGFYKINLTPSIVAKCRPMLDDLRLLDADNKQVPYITNNGETKFEQSKFEPFKKVSETIDANSLTKIVIENISESLIDNLVLILKNSLADRSVNISGSNDAQHWYIIKEYINLEMGREREADNFVQSIALPAVNYKYFQVTFNGKQHDPMFIEKVGTYKSITGLKNYFAVPSPRIIQKDSSNKYSYVQLVAAENYRIDKLQLFASGTKFYQRTLLFETGYYDSDKSQETAMLSSASDNIFFTDFYMDNHKTDTINFRIANNDNPPLRIDSVRLFQDAYVLYAYLKAGQKYQLAFGNDAIASPLYDLTAFKDSILTTTPLLNTSAIIANPINTSQQPEKSIFTKAWLWAVIIGVLGLLLFFTSSLLKQLRKNETT